MLPSDWARPFAFAFALACTSLGCGDDDATGSGGSGTGGSGTGGTGASGGDATGGSTTGGAGGSGGQATGGSENGGGGAGGSASFDCNSDSAWPAASVTLEDELVAAINAQRALGATCGVAVPAAPALTVDPTLHDLSRCWAKAMGDGGWLAYYDPNTGISTGISLFDAVENSAHGKPLVGAGIASGQTAAADLLASFMSDDTLCNAVMNPAATLVGVGHYEVGDHWVLITGD